VAQVRRVNTAECIEGVNTAGINFCPDELLKSATHYIQDRHKRQQQQPSSEHWGTREDVEYSMV